jgi:N-acetylmuramoyl-L-alanine amidase
MSDGDMDREEGFYILRKSWCPAVLTENFFMDSRSDLEYLQSRAGKQAVVDTHVEGIMEWLSFVR